MKSLKIILFSLLLLSPLFSQTEEYIFRQLTDADGLSQSTIFAMIQDRTGYLWLGTIDGLNRYDAYEFKVFLSDPSDDSSISDNFISAIYEDSEGIIWVGTVNGYLNSFNRKTEVFQKYLINDFFSVINKLDANFYEYPLAFSRNQLNTITSIIEDNSGYLWIGTWGNGIVRFDRKKSKGIHIYHNNNSSSSISSNRITDMIHDKDGIIWIATFGGGINKLEKINSSVKSNKYSESPEFVRYTSHQSSRYPLNDNKTISLFEDEQGSIWVGTFYGGLNLINYSNKFFPPDQLEFKYYNKSNGLSNNSVMAINQDQEGYIWIGTFGGGIYRIDPTNFKIINFSDLSSAQNPYTDIEILSLFVDRSGILWAGSHLGEGVAKIQKSQLKFNIINSKSKGNFKLNDDVVWSVLKDSKKNLWVGTYRGGVNIFNLSKDQRQIVKKSDDKIYGISDNHIRSFAEDKFGNIWIGTYGGGLNRISSDKKRIDVFRNEPGNPNSLSANQVQDIYIESETTIWVATFGGGLNRLNFSENTSDKPEFKVYQNDPSEPTSISDNRVYTVLKDSKGRFWVGTYGGGLNKFDEKSGKFEVVFPVTKGTQSVSGDKILCLQESSDGNIWIGTSNYGLNKFNPATGSIENFSISKGLTSAVVYGIVEDNKSKLWLSTDNGIFLFDVEEKRFIQFGIEDGVQSLEFNGGAHFKDDQGYIYFGGINGLNYFHPDSIKINQYSPPVIITNIKVMDTRIKGETDEIILSYDQNFISIEFSALDFSLPKRNRYSYILDGFQKSWIFTQGNNRTAVYTNLPAGEFTFMVKGTNSDGIWNEKAATLRIIINPPFYQTWWFVTLVVLTISLLIYYLGTIRVKSQLEIEKLKLKIASDLHDNIGAGLTEISILSEVAERKDTGSGTLVKSELHKISEKARHLVDSMSDIVWVVNPQRDSLYDLIVKLKDSYNEFFGTIGISFQVKNVEKSDDIILPMEYKQNLLLMFKEAINNAIKHSGCKKMTLEAFYKNDIIKIILKDDGKGFNINEVKFGNGIQNMQDRAAKIKGKLSWESEIDKGTTVTFSGKLGSLNKLKSLFR